MDGFAFAGLAIGVAAILFGQILEGGHASSLINGPAFLIVLGGSMGAIMLQAPPAHFRRAFSIFRWIFFPPKHSRALIAKKMLAWSETARKFGLLGLEESIDKERDPFIRKGLQLLVDGRDPINLRATLEMEILTKEDFDLAAARLFEAMGGYTPTIGIIGAVMGLIHVMENLSDPTKLGPGIATAFVATIYGVGLANLVLIPIGNKLKAIVQREAKYRELILETFLSIANGENPRNIELKMSGFTF